MGIHLMPPLFEIVIKPTELTEFEALLTSEGTPADAAFTGANWRGQTFNPSISHIITQVRLFMTQQDYAGDVTVAIRNTIWDGSRYVPTGADLVSATVPGPSLPDNPTLAWITFDLGAGTPLVAGTNYAIIWRAPTGDAYHWCATRWYSVGAGQGYLKGADVYSSNSGGSWGGIDTADHLFSELGRLV